MGNVGARWTEKDSISGSAALIFVYDKSKCNVTMLEHSFKSKKHFTEGDMINGHPINEASVLIQFKCLQKMRII